MIATDATPLRVLHVGKFFPPHQGGMEVFLADLVHAQRAQGIEAAALVHGEPLTDDPEWLTRVPVGGHLIHAPVAPGFRAALARMVQIFRPDVLHLHMPNTSAFWALTLAATRNLPWIVHWHSDVVPSRIRGALAAAYRVYRPFEQAVLKRAERVIVTSPAYLEASEPLSRWRDKCRILPLGLDIRRLPDAQPASAAAWPAGSFRLLSIGRLTYYKGFETLIRAVGNLAGAHLLIVGEGELRPALEALILRHTPPGESPRVTLLGAAPEVEKFELLASCDAFCLASRERTEAFGIAVLEAMRYGKPCLVSNLAGSGLPWLVQTSGAGQVIPPEDVVAWQHAIEALRGDAVGGRLQGEAGRAALVARFDIVATHRGIESIYDELREYAAGTPEQQPLIVIPARNEAATISAVIDALHSHGWNHIVVVNDQSHDDTAAIASAAGATVISPVLPMGAWGAMQTGIRYALRHGHQQVLTIDADGQHEPAYIPALLAAAGTCDVVIGAFPERGSPLRRIAWRYFRLITGFTIEDLTSGFRCYNRAACEILADEEATLFDYQDLGVLLLLRRHRLSIGEVPVEMYARTNGPSRIFASWSRIVRYMLESTLLCLARWHPKHHFRR